jgi:glucose-1-phosphate cytidylyltransferase
LSTTSESGTSIDLPILRDCEIDLVDAGPETATGGRIKRLQPNVGDGILMLTWGNGVADIDIPKLLAFHRTHGRPPTMTAFRPAALFDP